VASVRTPSPACASIVDETGSYAELGATLAATPASSDATLTGPDDGGTVVLAPFGADESDDSGGSDEPEQAAAIASDASASAANRAWDRIEAVGCFIDGL
jgi:hypothetical protein